MELDLATESLILLLCFLFLLSTWLVCHFAAPKASCGIRLLVIISFTLGLSGVVLLPIDLTETTVYDEEDIPEDGVIEPNQTYTPWLITYWSTFLLAWLVLPLFRESLLSGQFTTITRLQAGCRKAIRGYIFLVVVAISAVIFLAIRLKSWHVVPVLMALGNTYGLLLVSLLLGYGLVDVPMTLWRQANPAAELRRYRIMASNADEALFEAVWELQDCESLIDTVSEQISASIETSPMPPHYARCADRLLTLRKSTSVLNPELQRRRASGHRRMEEEHRNTPDGRPPLEYLATLNRRLERAQNEVVSAEQKWMSVLSKSQFYAELSEGRVPQPLRGQDPEEPSSSKACGFFRLIASQARYVWLRLLRKHVYKLLGMSAAVLSGMVLWSEATLSAPVNLSPFAFLLRLFDGEERGILFQLAALIPLVYMSLCVYGSLFKISLFGQFQLRGRNMSPGVALVFNAQYLVRLQFPLGYNYLFMIKYDIERTNCAFSHVMNNMATVPFFGTNFSVYAPLLILALCGFTLCKGYARLLAAMGIEHEDAILLGDPETLDTKVNEGITLLARQTSSSGNGFRRQTSENDLV